jgi:hypothetical protein
MITGKEKQIIGRTSWLSDSCPETAPAGHVGTHTSRMKGLAIPPSARGCTRNFFFFFYSALCMLGKNSITEPHHQHTVFALNFLKVRITNTIRIVQIYPQPIFPVLSPLSSPYLTFIHVKILTILEHTIVIYVIMIFQTEQLL